MKWEITFIDQMSGMEFHGRINELDTKFNIDVWGFGMTKEETERRVNLVVSAPELLDTLENLVIGIGMGWDLEGLVEEAEKAIAKATGKEAQS